MFGIGYRQISAFAKSLEKLVSIIGTPSYSQINRRFNQLGLNLVNSLLNTKDGQGIAIDSSGIKLHKSGEWIRENMAKKSHFLNFILMLM